MGAPTGVLVVGAGIVGLATAWRAAQDGVDVTIVSDSTRPTASRAAVGGLSFCPADAVLAGHADVIELSAITKASFGDYIASLERASGVPTLYRRQPTLVGDLGASDAALIDKIEAARSKVGLASVRLTADECHALEPGLSSDLRAALLLSDHEQIDSRAFTESLLAACRAAGVRFIDGRVRRLDVSGGRITGATLDAGRTIPANAVVLAAGAWTSMLDGLPPELHAAVRPVSGQVVVVSVPEHVRAPRHDLRSANAYMVVRSDRSVVIGATKVARGFDASATVAGVHSLLSAGAALWPGLLDCEWQHTVVGLRPQSDDGLPIVGATSIDGLYAATGHFRNGVMFGAASADAVVAAIRGDQPARQFESFSPLRGSVTA